MAATRWQTHALACPTRGLFWKVQKELLLDRMKPEFHASDRFELLVRTAFYGCRVLHVAGLPLRRIGWPDASLKVTWISQVHRPSVYFHFYGKMDFSNGCFREKAAFSVPWETAILFYDDGKYELNGVNLTPDTFP